MIINARGDRHVGDRIFQPTQVRPINSVHYRLVGHASLFRTTHSSNLHQLIFQYAHFQQVQC